MKKYSVIVSLEPGSFDSRLFDYINKHNSQWYSSAEIIDIAAQRLRSKSFYSDEIAYLGPFFNWLFTWKRVGKELAKKYVECLQTFASKTLFCTKNGEISSKDIWILVITPEKKEVHIVTSDRKNVCQVFYHDFPTKKVEATDISNFDIRISVQINRVLKEKKIEFKALTDLMIVLKHVLPDIDICTSVNKKRELIKALNLLSEDDEDYILLTTMADDLLSDINLVFNNIEMYWG